MPSGLAQPTAEFAEFFLQINHAHLPPDGGAIEAGQLRMLVVLHLERVAIACTVSKSRNHPFAPKGLWILAGGVTLRYLHMSGIESLS